MAKDFEPDSDLAVVISNLAAGGAQKALVSLVHGWLDQQLRVCLITFSHPRDDFFYIDPKVTRVVLDSIGHSTGPFMAIASNIRRIIRLRSALKRCRAPTILSFVGTTNILTIIASFGLRRKVVISERNDPQKQSLGKVWDLLRRRLYRRADVVTVISEASVAALAQYVPLQNIRPVPLVADLPRGSLQEDQDTQRQSCQVLTVARFHHQKAHDVLLQAFAIFHASHPTWKMVLVGDGELRAELQEQARRLGLWDAVVWAGERHDTETFYRSASMFVLPSRYEGMSNALVEALSYGLPAVVTDASPGPLELVEHEKSGLVVPVDDVSKLAMAMTRLAEDIELRGRLGREGRKRVDKLDLDTILGAWNDALGIENKSSRDER